MPILPTDGIMARDVRVIVKERANDPPYPFNHKCKLDRNSLQQ